VLTQKLCFAKESDKYSIFWSSFHCFRLNQIREIRWQCIPQNWFNFFKLAINESIRIRKNIIHLYIFRKPKDIAIVFGDHDQIQINETKHIDALVKKIYTHPKFNSETHDNDIALLQMTNSIKFRKHIRPACLPFHGACRQIFGNYQLHNLRVLRYLFFLDKDPPAADAWIVGWGKEHALHTHRPATLREVKIKMITRYDCSNHLEYFGRITENMLCGGGFDKESCEVSIL
jgi:Trypsin